MIVLGHPGYYPRFGFSAELALRIQCPFARQNRQGGIDTWIGVPFSS